LPPSEASGEWVWISREIPLFREFPCYRDLIPLLFPCYSAVIPLLIPLLIPLPS